MHAKSGDLRACAGKTGGNMSSFMQELAEQRWDDHRYYHHSLINQSLHFVSATTFVVAYCLVWNYPWLAALLGWGVAMTSRQAGHFFFEPKGYDQVNQATHEYKEDIKVGYNLRRKVILHALWGIVPIVLFIEPTLFGIFEPHTSPLEFVRHVALVWLTLGIGALAFRTVQLFLIRDVRTGLVWMTKIITDPFNDAMIYKGAPLALL